jgi:hypothetical protein
MGRKLWTSPAAGRPISGPSQGCLRQSRQELLIPYERQHAWTFASAYDFTYSDGPAVEQSSMAMGEGKNPGVDQLKALGKEHRVKNAPSILDKSPESGWALGRSCR